jgi:cardiolipin synthase
MAGRSNDLERYRRALEGLLGIPATEGNRVDILRNGDEIFPALLDAIRSAKRTVDFLTFVYWAGSIGEEFAQALADRARDGVRVRVILDALGAYTIDSECVDLMHDAGCHVEWFRPVNKLKFWDADHRTHRKVLICDEEVAFTGGIGIADEWRGNARNPSEWRDTHFRVQGPTVCGIRAAFVQNWGETGGQLFDENVDVFPDQPQDGPSTVQVVRGAAEVGWSDVATLTRSLLCLARERVRITTAYFVPDESTSELLCQAAKRGVDVEVLIPGPHIDKRFVQVAGESTYAPLLEGGVKLWTYQPTMLHAKTMTVDGLVANVGSANLNSRSLEFDDEVNLVVFDPEVAGELDRQFDDDRSASEPIDLENWEDRSVVQRVKEAASDLIDRRI